MRALPVLIVLLLALPCMSIAQESGDSPDAVSPQPELGKWWGNSKIVNELELSKKQVRQIEESYLNHQMWLIPLIDELESRENQLDTLMQAERLDDEEILAQAELIAADRAKLEKEHTSIMLSIRKALTARQWIRLVEIQDLRSISRARILTRDAIANSSGISNGTIVSTRTIKKIYSVKDGITSPKILHRPMPPYTQEARDSKVEGLVLLEVIIRKDGNVDSVKVLKSVGYGLDESAIHTITKEWRFQPGTLNGQPVDVRANIEVSFRRF
jgi:TonB family protein